MLFRTLGPDVIAISQPMHAWIAGQLLRAWSEAQSEPVLLAAEQHDLGWLDWEGTPSFDETTGRPHLFRDVGAALHAPMWAAGVDRALGAWGAHVALLISRHGGVIYRRFTTRHRLSEADGDAARHYLETQAPKEAAWAKALALDDDQLARESALIACVDTLSLALCGELKAPLSIEAPGMGGETQLLELVEKPGRPFDFTLSPWPFRGSALRVEGEGLALPEGGQLADEASMRQWLKSGVRRPFSGRLSPMGT
jgi:hypothetical protein